LPLNAVPGKDSAKTDERFGFPVFLSRPRPVRKND
jgi:hypothetical protein